MSYPRLHRGLRTYRNLQLPPSNGGGSSNPPEWAGTVPLADWDAANAVNALGFVSDVIDASGNGHHLIGLDDPEYIESALNWDGPSIEFSGTARLTGSLPTVTELQPLYIFAVAASNSGNAFAHLITLGTNSAGLVSINGIQWQAVHSTGTVTNVAADPNPGAVIGVGVTDFDLNLYYNSSTPLATTGLVTEPFDTSVYIGNASTPDPVSSLVGGMGRILVFNENLTAGQLNTIVTQLRSKYGV